MLKTAVFELVQQFCHATEIGNAANSDVVETATFETETWLKFRDETETETSSKTPRPRLET